MSKITTFKECKRVWESIPKGLDRDRQKRFIETHSRHVLDHATESGMAFHFTETRNLDTGKRFMSVGCGFAKDTQGITPNEARSLIGLPALKPMKITGTPKPKQTLPPARTYTAPIATAMKKKMKPLTQSVPKSEPKPFKLGGRNLLSEKSPKPLKRK